MNRCVRLPLFFLLALALIGGYPVCGAPAPDKDAGQSAEQKESAEQKKESAEQKESAESKKKSAEKKQAAKRKKGAAEKEHPAEPKKETAEKKESAESKKEAAEAKKESAEPKKDSAAKPPTYVVKPGPLKIEVSLDGVYEAQNMTEVVLRPQEWLMLSVLSAVEHGAKVKHGDLLVALDLEKIDRAIADLRSEQQVTELAVQQAEQALHSLETFTPLDLTASQRTQRVAGEDEKLFADVNRPMLAKTSDFILKMAQQFLEYEEEELRQLEKMYKADEITEETEQIVLKRARNQVDQAKFMVERARVDHDQTAKFTLPRTEEKIKDAAQRSTLQWEKDKAALPLALKRQRLDLEKLKLQRSRGEDRLSKLLADRAMMTVKAPADGVLYYGKCLRGKWLTGLAGEGLRRGANVAPNDVFVTIVQPRPIFIRAVVPEKDLQNVKAGVKGTVKSIGYPDLKLTAIVDRVAAIPAGSGGFDARITMALDPQAEPLMPGMSCTVKLVAYEKKDALAVPAAAVSTDEQDEQKNYVYLAVKDKEPKKQEVKLGKRTDKQVEILSGLAAGDEILLEPPKEKK
jgi:multidrug resistance efflux pump